MPEDKKSQKSEWVTYDFFHGSSINTGENC